MNLKHLLFAGLICALSGMLTTASANSVRGGVQNDALQSEKRTVTGTVVDATTGEPIIGATIIEKGSTTNGTTSDYTGAFSITLPRGAQLDVSYVGYKTRTVDVGTLGVVDVKLEPDDALEAVVVVGAGTQKKISVTGSVAAIAGDDLRFPSSSLTSGLAGKLAGVISMAKSGAPGETTDFYIRGVGTFGGRATPLILLDDIEISASDLNKIPAETIENFTILKDASATAIYGVRGANGVMIVTTKKGQENTRAKIGVTIENSFVQPTHMIEYADGATWMDIYNKAYMARGGTTPIYSAEVIEYTRSGKYPYAYPDVDWQDLLFKNFNMNQRANVNIQGGGNRATYYMSLNVSHDSGIIDAPKDYIFNNNLNRFDYNFQNNISYKLSKSTTLDLRLNAQINEISGVGENVNDLFSYAIQANPVTYPAFYPSQEGDDHIRFGNAIKTGKTMYVNPYAAMLDDHSIVKENKLNVSLNLDQQLDFITKGLSVKGLVNWSTYSWTKFSQSMTPYYYTLDKQSYDTAYPDFYNLQQLQTGDEYIQESYSEPWTEQTFYFDARLMYNRRFGRHTVSGLLMYMMRDYRPQKSLSQRNQGLSGRVTYDFDQRYFAEFNFGYNGTERLAAKDRFEFFPAMSLGWAVSSERFWEPVRKYVDFFKIRGSYGLVGSDGFNDDGGRRHFLYLNSINLYDGDGQASFGQSTSQHYDYYGPTVTVYATPDASWERVKKLDIGVDISLFRQLNITFDYFCDKRDRIFMARGSWPDIMGYQNVAPWGQVGRAENEGYELSVNWNKQIGKDWAVDLRFNFSYNRNKYTNYDDPDYAYTWQSHVGRPLDGYCWYGYVADGLFSSQEEIDNHATQLVGGTPMVGDIKYRDLNGDGVINSDDQCVISDYGTTPRIQYGIGLNLRWRKWDLGLFFNGSGMRTQMLNRYSAMDPFGADLHNLTQFVADNYWSEENPNPHAKYPRLGTNENDISNNTGVWSTYWMRNARFLRFKTLEVGYSFKYGRVYVNGDNLAVWSPWDFCDPELAEWVKYPFQRTFTLGLQLKF